jgi:hypothetical protein
MERIYKTLGYGSKSYFEIDSGQRKYANAFFAGANYTGPQGIQLNYLRIAPRTCQDNYQYSTGWYYISIDNGNG